MDRHPDVDVVVATRDRPALMRQHLDTLLRGMLTEGART